jgi:DNA-binding transcriptional ArsR family regulator
MTAGPADERGSDGSARAAGSTSTAETAESDSTADATGTTGALNPAEAFKQLGNETRVDVVRTLAEEGPCSFSTLFERSDRDTSAGFAYHLRQLADGFVRQREDEQWELTAAGREVARAVQAGLFADSADVTVDLVDACPVCRERGLTLDAIDGVAEIACQECDNAILKLPLPPSGYTRDAASIPDALDAYHRNRIRTFADGICPDCGGTVTTTVEQVPPEGSPEQADGDHGDHPNPVQCRFACEGCGASLDCPVTLAVRDHPAVVSFYEYRGEDVGGRPLWNVGPEWRERVVSTEPWCLLVSTRLGDDVLDLYVDREGVVRAHRQRQVEGETCSAEQPGRYDSAGEGNSAARVPATPDARARSSVRDWYRRGTSRSRRPVPRPRRSRQRRGRRPPASRSRPDGSNASGRRGYRVGPRLPIRERRR